MGIGIGEKESLRLQDFIVLANGGKEVRLSVELKKPVVTPKFHPGQLTHKKMLPKDR